MKYDGFIGRRPELEKLQRLKSKKTASLVVMRGRRRIGKSRLASEFAKNLKFYQFSGLAPDPKISAQDQRNEFALQLSQQTGLPQLRVEDWTTLFQLLAEKVASGTVVILFDEITWMAHDDPTFLGKLKNAWDMFFCKNNQLILILCGSVSAWIEKNIINSTGFFGRISLDIILKELPLKQCNQLLETLGFNRSNYEKMQYLAVTGCIPWYIEQINPKQSAEQNIKNLCFEPNALFINEFEKVFHDIFGKRGEIYQKIVRLLAAGSLDYKTLAAKLNYAKGSMLTTYLQELISASYISDNYSWTIHDGKISTIRRYKLVDNYLRFYCKYIDTRKKAINEGKFVEVNINQLPGWHTMLGLQFENIVLNNRELIIKELAINPIDIIADDPYFQRKTARHDGCQIDYLIQTKLNTLFACEFKFSRTLSASKVIKDMQDKLKKLALPRGFAILPVLVHFGELEQPETWAEYFYKTIDMSELMIEKN